MSMDLAPVGGGKRPRVVPSMNVTPLVDVVLVLLIIFMVIAPMMVKKFWVHVPKKETAATANAQPDPDDVPVVLTVRADRSVWINKDAVALGELGDKVARIMAAKRDTVIFFDAEDGVPYGDALRALDAARGGGAVNIAVLTDPVVR
jgi:biopolymer transport protein TolR